MKTMFVLALVLLGVTSPAALAGQQPGDIVRVSGEHTGEFIRADSAGLHLSFGFVPYGTMESLEIKVGRRSLWRPGMRQGAVFGAGTGATLGLLACALGQQPSGNNSCFPDVLLVPAVMAAYGAGIGALIGATMRRDLFDSIPVPVPGVRVELRPGSLPRSLSIGFRVPIG